MPVPFSRTVKLIDLDGDGDLDVLTCEEAWQGRGLGVVSYENVWSIAHSHDMLDGNAISAERS